MKKLSIAFNGDYETKGSPSSSPPNTGSSTSSETSSSNPPSTK